MGHGSYSTVARTARATTMGYHTKSVYENFSKNFNKVMNPAGITLREARDNAEHPNSLAIIIGLDVTGSMDRIPQHMVRDGLPHIVQNIIDAGIPDPQVLFMAIGDHECDQAPLQVGQFESSDELMDKWLTEMWPEGNGGSNDGESYMLPWFFAARRTTIDCFEKREQKGFLFTIGDEPVLDEVPVSALKRVFGPGQYDSTPSAQLLQEAQILYNVFHVHVREGYNGQKTSVINGWRELLGDNLLIAEDYTQIPAMIASTVTAIHEEETAEDINVAEALTDE